MIKHVFCITEGDIDKGALDEVGPCPPGCEEHELHIKIVTPRSGTAVFTDEASKIITYATPYANQTLNIQLTPDGNVNCWYTDVTKDGFTLHVSTQYTGNVFWETEGY